MGRIRHAVIMAAGRGHRMMPATEALPKPMIPYLQSTLVASGIERIRPFIEHIHVTVGYKGAMLARHLIEHGVSSIHNTDGRSNSWWIYNSLLSELDEPLFVLTCDNITELDFDALTDDYFRLGEPPCLIVPVKPVDGLDGDYIFHDGPVVTNLDRNTPAPSYCSGIQVLNPRKIIASTSGEGDFGTLWRELIAKRELLVSSVHPTHWFSVDTVQQLEQASTPRAGA